MKTFAEFINEQKVNELSSEYLMHAANKAAGQGRRIQGAKFAKEANRRWGKIPAKQAQATIQKVNYQPKTKEELIALIDSIFSTSNDEVVDLNKIDVSRITDMSKLFMNCDRDFDISQWDTSKVTNMSWMFAYTEKFNGDISDWDTSNVTDTHAMFEWAESFNQDISGWNTSNVTNMSWMFAYTKSFKQDISRWDTSEVTDMSWMFAYAKSFNKDISNWNTSEVTNMDSMFYHCPLRREYRPKFTF